MYRMRSLLRWALPRLAVYFGITFGAMAIFMLVCMFVAASRAQDCEVGSFGCGHEQMHEQYKDWNGRKLGPNGLGGLGSCCSGTDCRPVRARQDMAGNWQIWIPELHRWADVPESAMNEPDRFHDGRSHACTADPLNWSRYGTSPLPIYCFSPAEQKS